MINNYCNRKGDREKTGGNKGRKWDTKTTNEGCDLQNWWAQSGRNRQAVKGKVAKGQKAQEAVRSN